MLVPAALVLLLTSLLVDSESFAEDGCVCGLPERVECYWEWTPPSYCELGRCASSGGSASDTCGGPGVRRNPWGVFTGQQAPSGQTALAVDSCGGGGATAGGSSTDVGIGKLRHRNRCAFCRGRVSLTVVPSFSACANAYEPPSNCKAYGLMEATGIPVQNGHSPSNIASNAGGASSGYPTAPTVQFSVGLGEQKAQVTLTQSPTSPYSKASMSTTGSRTWNPDVSWVDVTFLGSASLEAFADGWFIPPLLAFDVGAAASHIPNRGHWNAWFVLECLGGCGVRQNLSWDSGAAPHCPSTLP